MRRAARSIICKDDLILVMHRSKFGQEYDILIGGGVEMGEDPAQAALREIAEETAVAVGPLKLVFIERAPEPYGTQYIFICDYISGDPKIDPTTPEAKINLMGHNLYQPVWRKISELKNVELHSPQLKEAMIEGFQKGFPDQPVDITNFLTV